MSDPQTLSYESPQTPLNGIGIGTIALQLVGVYCITQALPILSMLATYLGASGGMRGAGAAWQILLSFMMPGIYIVMGVLLIRFGPRLSAWLFRDAVGGVMAGPITAPAGRYLQAVAFSVAGVLAMVNAAPQLVSLIWLALSDMGARMGGFSEMVQPVAQFAVGLVLFLQSEGLSRVWHRIRAGGAIADPQAPIHRDPDKA